MLSFRRTEVMIYVVERSPNGTSKRVPASTLFNYMEQANVKNQLQQLGVMMSVTRTALSHAQLKQLLQNPPAGARATSSDIRIWRQDANHKMFMYYTDGFLKTMKLK